MTHPPRQVYLKLNLPTKKVDRPLLRDIRMNTTIFLHLLPQDPLTIPTPPQDNAPRSMNVLAAPLKTTPLLPTTMEQGITIRGIIQDIIEGIDFGFRIFD